jgi:hypothetical protein
MTAVVRAILEWLAGGSALAALVSLLAIICALTFVFIYRRYLGILGADRRRPVERRAYDALRQTLVEGNLAIRLYAQWLTSFLRAVDHFFGDAGIPDRTLFPHAFRLRTPAPLWTAPSLDRCLLLALIYPVVAIFVIWAISGHVGPAEASLELKADLSAWRRGFAAAGFAFLIFALWQSIRTKGWKARAWIAGVSGAVVGGIFVFTTAALAAFAIAIAVAIAFIGPRTGAGVSSFALAGMAVFGTTLVVANPPSHSLDVAGDVLVGVALIVAIGLCITVIVLNQQAIQHQWEGVFLLLFFPTMSLACFGAPYLPLSPKYWGLLGPLLLFLGLLTLLNAPFVWASLGVTRALLRRGLELGGWWPYALGIVDAALAALIIAGLALTIVVGVQTFDALAKHGGDAPVLPLELLFSGIAVRPSAPEYWWIYALLLSTMIPSLVNLVIGGTSLIRGLPGLPLLLLRFVPARGAVPEFNRPWIAAVLTTQVAIGAALGIAAQALLVVGIMGYVMPFFGLELLDMARGVAAFNLPARAGQLFGVTL